jgi:hypothetical protein
MSVDPSIFYLVVPISLLPSWYIQHLIRKLLYVITDLGRWYETLVGKLSNIYNLKNSLFMTVVCPFQVSALDNLTFWNYRSCL